MSKPLSVIAVSTVLPRPCGIATFHQDVSDSLEPFSAEIVNIALQRGSKKYAYPTSTIATIRQEVKSDYARAAALINSRQPDVVLVQHEFGIYGGNQGHYLLELLRRLAVPAVVVLHRYEMAPATDMKRFRVKVTHDIARHAQAIIIISKLARDKLAADLAAEGVATPVIHIPHGAPAVADYTLSNPKQVVLHKQVPTLATFGLISERKGIQEIVASLPALVQQFPSLVYRILGRPHPADPKAQALLRSMKQQVKDLNLAQHVVFVTRFLSVQDIMENLQATDIYITFYADPDQTSSGTLTFALAAGCCVISTPYIHARELLTGGRGVIIPFGDRAALTQAVAQLLGNPEQLQRYRQQALAFGRTIAWPLVGQQYAAALRAAAAPALNRGPQ